MLKRSQMSESRQSSMPEVAPERRAYQRRTTMRVLFGRCRDARDVDDVVPPSRFLRCQRFIL